MVTFVPEDTTLLRKKWRIDFIVVGDCAEKKRKRDKKKDKKEKKEKKKKDKKHKESKSSKQNDDAGSEDRE